MRMHTAALYTPPAAGDAVQFFHRCVAALKPGGIIVVKDNVLGQGVLLDRSDASITRWGAACAAAGSGPARLRSAAGRWSAETHLGACASP